jgi:hypothetical protein
MKRTITLDEDEQVAVRIALHTYLDQWEARQPGPYRSPVFLHRGSNVDATARALNRLKNVAHGQPEDYNLERAPILKRPVTICEAETVVKS